MPKRAVKVYEQSATRLENRGDHPPTAAYVADLVAGIKAAGVEAIWHSAVDSLGRPLFPSHVFPDCHPAANRESFQHLLTAVHRRGIPILSWYPLNLGGGVLASHPDWQMHFYEIEGTPPNPEWTTRYACFNSPYGELLPRFAAEIVRDVGFDGVWFDGSTFSNHNTGPWFAPGCRCPWCRERFRRDTGAALPARVDFSDKVFRRWLTWRYDVLMSIWKACVDAVTQVRPAAVVGFNNYRRRTPGRFGWNTAIPLRRFGWDCLLSGELDNFPHQADFQMKMHHAYECARGAESWWPLCDHWHMWVPDHDPLPAIQAHLGAISAGGAACMGIGVSAKLVAPVLKAIQKEAGPRIAFNTGKTVEYAALWCSQQHQDFGCPGNPNEAWDQWHGMNEICRHNHLQTSIVFDDHVANGALARFPVLLMGETRCISRTQSEHLRRYVEQGGLLVACGAAGTLDEWGDPHALPVLDDLLGIIERQAGAGSPSLELRDRGLARVCGRHVSYEGPFGSATAVGDARLLADVVSRTTGGWDGIETTGPAASRSPALWLRRVGRGCVVWAGVEMFASYLHAPTPQKRKLFGRLLQRLCPPTLALDGPICVTVNTRIRDDGVWMIHLHNNPGTAYAYPAPERSNYLHSPGEVVEVHDVAIHLRAARARSAQAAIEHGKVVLRDGGRTILLPRLRLHEVVLARMK